MHEIFKWGDLVKSENRVFEVRGITQGSATIPAGWLIDKTGASINPSFCKKYIGATSCFNNSVKD
mgnify:CR=1 FL=1